MGIGDEQMAKHPCSFGPFLLVPADTEEVDEPVQVGLEIGLLHSGKPEQIAPEPRAQVVHELHRLQICGIGYIGFVRLIGALGGFDKRPVRSLLIVYDHRAGGYMRKERVVDALGGGLPVTASLHDRVFERVDGDRDADLVLGKPPLLREFGATNDIGIGEIELVDPNAPAQDEPILVAVDRGEYAVSPLVGSSVADAADLRGQVDGRVVAHAGDEALPGGKLLLAVFEHRCGKRGKRRAAGRAAPALMSGGRPPVAGAVGKRAGRTRWMRIPKLDRLIERSGADEVSASALLDSRAKGIEVDGIEGRDRVSVGVDGNHGEFLSAQAAIRSGMSPNIGPDGHLGKSMFGDANGITCD